MRGEGGLLRAAGMRMPDAGDAGEGGLLTAGQRGAVQLLEGFVR